MVAGVNTIGNTPSSTSATRGALVAGGIAALLASACCLGPLVLLLLGVSGAWVSNLTALEAYRPIFIGVALAALYYAQRRIFRPARDCAPGEICTAPVVNRRYRALFWVVVMLLGIALGFPYIATAFY